MTAKAVYGGAMDNTAMDASGVTETNTDDQGRAKIGHTLDRTPGFALVQVYALDDDESAPRWLRCTFTKIGPRYLTVQVLRSDDALYRGRVSVDWAVRYTAPPVTISLQETADPGEDIDATLAALANDIEDSIDTYVAAADAWAAARVREQWTEARQVENSGNLDLHALASVTSTARDITRPDPYSESDGLERGSVQSVRERINRVVKAQRSVAAIRRMIEGETNGEADG